MFAGTTVAYACVATAAAAQIGVGDGAATDAAGVVHLDRTHVPAPSRASAAAPEARGPAVAPDERVATRGELDMLRVELEVLREQVRALTALVRDRRADETVTVDVPRTPGVGGDLAPSAQIAATASRPPVRVIGTMLSTSAYNSSDANWIDAPNVVGTASGGSLTSSVRQSRVGVAIDPFAVGAWQASGRLELDFFGGTPAVATGSTMPLPRLVTGMFRLARGSRAVAAGQDQVLFAPRDPTSLAALAVPQLYRAGNLFLRAPQIRLEQRLADHVTLSGALVAPVTGDSVPSYSFAPVAGAGERAQRPAFEARAAYAAGSPDSPSEAQIGVSGRLGWLRQVGQRTANGGAALDLFARIGRFGVAGELFAAEDLDAFGAGLAQPGRALGGWLELHGVVLPRVSLTGGGGLDRRPDGAGLAGRARNASVFGNVIVRIGPAVSTSLEYRWLQTRYVSGRDRVNHHVVAAMALRF